MRVYVKVFGIEAMLDQYHQWHSDNQKLEKLLNDITPFVIDEAFSAYCPGDLLAQQVMNRLGGKVTKIVGKRKDLPPDLIV